MAPGLRRIHERSFEMRAQHDRLARPSRRGDRHYGGSDFSMTGAARHDHQRRHGRAVRSAEAHEGADAFFAALPIGAAAVDVKIEASQQKQGSLRARALRRHFADGVDARPPNSTLPSPIRRVSESSLRRCGDFEVMGRLHRFTEKKDALFRAFPVATSQRPVSASPFGSRMGRPAFSERSARRGATRPPAA